MTYEYTSIILAFCKTFRYMLSKEQIRLGFAEHLLKLDTKHARDNGVKQSLRSLAARSGLEYSHVQRISKGKVDLSLSTIFALAQGLDIPPKELLNF